MTYTADELTDDEIRALYDARMISLNTATRALSTDARRRYTFETREAYEQRRGEQRAAREACAQILNAHAAGGAR